MKKSLVFSLMLGLLMLGPLGCETLMTREGVREAEQKREINDRVTTLQKTTADVNSRFADIDADQRQTNGRIEVLENRMGQMALERERQRKVADDQVAEMQKKLELMQEELGKLADTTNALNAEVAALRANASSDSNATATSTPTTTTAYDLAEDLFSKKDFKKAILNYQKFREARPKDKQVPDAIYKTGVSFQELGLKDEAKSFYQELIGKYPNSIEAKKARIRLKKMK
jgi:TolA-binding protein